MTKLWRLQRVVRGALSWGRQMPRSAWHGLKAELLLAEYRFRADRYWTANAARVKHQVTSQQPENSRSLLFRRGLSIEPAKLGAIHTLAFVPMIGWHGQLLPDLRRLGPVSHFDYTSQGLNSRELFGRSKRSLHARRHANEAFVEFARSASAKARVHWVFVYASGLEILANTIDRVREATGAPVVGMCLDDRQSWEASEFGEQRPGQVDIAGHLDLAWTSAKVATAWYLAEGGNPLYLGEGCSPDIYSPGAVSQDIDVCFVGQKYGFRESFIRALRQRGIDVRVAGPGWPEGPLSDEGMLDLFRRSRIILGHGGIGWAPTLRNLKGRDFDAPCVGTAAYVTSYTPELADHFRIGEEIACYSGPDDAVDVIRGLLDDEPRRQAMAQAGRRRCLADHRWSNRFEQVLQVLGVLERA